MPTNRAFAYNPDHISVDGTYNIGDLAVGVTRQNYNTKPGGLTWWGSPDEEQGYVIAVPVPGNTQPTHVPPIGTVFASVKFLGTKVFDNPFDDSTFIALVNQYFVKDFTGATEASTWLTGHGFWNSYPIPVLSLDAGNPLSYSGTGNVWTDLIGGKTFNINYGLGMGPIYTPFGGGSLEFNPSNYQYAECSTSLPDLSRWSIGVWHYYNGNTTGDLPCIITEIYPGLTGNINYSLGYDTTTGYLNAGFYNYLGWNISGGYVLTPNNWYYIVGTYDGSSLTLYINGTLVITNPNVNTNSISSQGGIRLMRRWDGDNYWGGNLATVDIYNGALNQAEINSIWNNTKTRYFGVLPTSGLTLYVDAGNPLSYSGSGNQWYDLSGNNNTGTLQNSPTYSSSDGGVLTFNGSQYISFSSPTNIPIGNSNYTISVWFNTNSLGGNGFVGWGNWGSGNQVNAFRLAGSNILNYWWGNDLAAVASITTNTWYNAVARFDGTNREIWVNNVMVGQDTPGSSHNVSNANNMRIGSTNNGEYFDGKISNVGIYDRALSDSEIGDIFNNLKSRFGL